MFYFSPSVSVRIPLAKKNIIKVEKNYIYCVQKKTVSAVYYHLKISKK